MTTEIEERERFAAKARSCFRSLSTTRIRVISTS